MLKPNLPEAYNLRGRLDFIDSDLPSAETAFRRALALDSNSFDALFFLGTLLREQGRLKESHFLLERALQIQPKEIGARYQFALQCAAEGNDKRAAALLESLIKDAPNYAEAHRSLSTIYFRVGRVADGRQERKLAEEIDAQIQAKDQELGRSLK
jgi:tetratricopeptide (TPR) repeat protein